MKRKSKIFTMLVLSVILCFSVTFFACKKQQPLPAVQTVQIKLNTSELKLRIYSEYTLAVKTNGDYQVAFSSENTSVATVSQDGKINAIEVGQTKINVSCQNVTASCVVTVYETTEIPTFILSGIDESGVARLLPGQTFKVNPIVKYGGEEVEATVTMKSSDETVVSVENNGKVTALKQGSVTVNCIAVYKKWTVDASFSIEVTLDTVIILSKYQTVIYSSDIAGQKTSDYIESAEVYENGIIMQNQPTITWTSDDQTIATVQDGLINATGVGSTLIKATCTVNGKEYSANVKVTVKQPELDYAQAFTVENGLLKWQEVEFADGYKLTVNLESFEVSKAEYNVSNLFGKVEFTVVPTSNNEQINDGAKVKFNYDFDSGLITEKVLKTSPTAEGSTITKVGTYDGQDVYHVVGKTTGFEVGTGNMFKLIYMTPFMESRVNSQGKQPFLTAEPIVSNDLDNSDYLNVSISFWAYSFDGDVSFTLANTSGSPSYVGGATIQDVCDIKERTWTKVTLDVNQDIYKSNYNLYAGIFASKEFYFTDIRVNKIGYEGNEDFTNLGFYAGMEFEQTLKNMPANVPDTTSADFVSFDNDMAIVLNAYQELSETRKQGIEETVISKFNSLCLGYVNKVISTLPNENNLTCYDGERINKVYNAYSVLSDELKAQVTEKQKLIQIKETYDENYIVVFSSLSPWFTTITDAYKRVDLGVNSYYATVNYSTDLSYYDDYGTVTKAVILAGETNQASDMSNNMHTVFDIDKVKQMLEQNPDVMEIRFSILSPKTGWEINKVGSKDSASRVYTSMNVNAGNWTEVVISRQDGLTMNGALRRASMSLNGEQTIYLTNLYLVRSATEPIIDAIRELPDANSISIYDGSNIYQAYSMCEKLPEDYRAEITNADKLLAVKTAYENEYGMIFVQTSSWINAAKTGTYAANAQISMTVDEVYGLVVKCDVDKKDASVTNSHNYRVHFNSLKNFLEANTGVSQVKFKVYTTKTSSEYMINGTYYKLNAGEWTEITLSRDVVLAKDSQTFSIGALTSTSEQTIMFTNFYYEKA